jgi:hypothetical protein
MTPKSVTVFRITVRAMNENTTKRKEEKSNSKEMKGIPNRLGTNHGEAEPYPCMATYSCAFVPVPHRIRPEAYLGG